MELDDAAAEDRCPQLPKKKRQRPEPVQHRWLDPWLSARGEPLKALVERSVAFLKHHEGVVAKRARARKANDHAVHLRRIEAVVCNLAHAVLLPPPTGRIAVRLGKGQKGRSRYDSVIQGKPLSPLIWMLDEVDFLDLNWSTLRGEVSSVAPSPWFARRVEELKVQLSDFGRDVSEEVIILSRNSRPNRNWRDESARVLTREPIDYADTPTTLRSRDELRRVNVFLAAADIEFLDDGLEPRVDPLQRTLKRRFIILPDQDVRFDQGGRLFYGFWSNLKSTRRDRIRIKGEPVADLDFSSMFTRLAYSKAGSIPPDGDLYAIPGAESHRSGIKLAMNCFLFDTTANRRSWPSVMGVGVGDDGDADRDPLGEAAAYAARLPGGWTVAKTKAAILARHPVLKGMWGRGLGYELMFIESEIIMEVLQRLASKGVPALPMHDGLLVASSEEKAAKGVMQRVALSKTGLKMAVTKKN